MEKPGRHELDAEPLPVGQADLDRTCTLAEVSEVLSKPAGV